MRHTHVRLTRAHTAVCYAAALSERAAGMPCTEACSKAVNMHAFHLSDAMHGIG